MIRIIVVTAVLFIASLLSAQSSKEAKEILDKTYSRLTESKGIELSFKTTTREADGREYEPQAGKAYIKGDKFRLEIEEMTIWFNGTTQWVFLNDLNEVNISNPDKDELIAISPTSILGIYRENFTLRAPLSKMPNGRGLYFIEMTPDDDNREIISISISIDKNSYNPVEIILTMKGGMQNSIDITKYASGNNFADDEFEFEESKYPEVEIVDLR